MQSRSVVEGMEMCLELGRGEGGGREEGEGGGVAEVGWYVFIRSCSQKLGETRRRPEKPVGGGECIREGSGRAGQAGAGAVARAPSPTSEGTG